MVSNTNCLQSSGIAILQRRVLRILTLLDIPFYRLNRYITGSPNIVTRGPKFTSTFVGRKLGILHKQASGRNPFEEFSYFRWAITGRGGNKKMYVVPHYLKSLNLPVHILRSLINNIFKRMFNIINQKSLSVFSYPNHVISYLIMGILGFTFHLHRYFIT